MTNLNTYCRNFDRPLRLFADTNVFLNIILEETDCFSSLQFLDGWKRAGSIGRVSASYLSFADMAYVIRKRKGKLFVYQVLEKFMRHIDSVLDCNEKQMKCAMSLQGPDFEDKLQYACALEHGCDIIVTCNRKHFEKISGTENLRNLPMIATPGEILSSDLMKDVI